MQDLLVICRLKDYLKNDNIAPKNGIILFCKVLVHLQNIRNVNVQELFVHAAVTAMHANESSKIGPVHALF